MEIYTKVINLILNRKMRNRKHYISLKIDFYIKLNLQKRGSAGKNLPKRRRNQNALIVTSPALTVVLRLAIFTPDSLTIVSPAPKSVSPPVALYTKYVSFRYE